MAIQDQQTVHCEVMPDSGQTVKHSSVHSDTEPRGLTVWGTDSEQTVEHSSGHSDTEPTNGRVWGTDRQWTDCRR